MTAADRAPFAWAVRVYWEDTDGGGIVYYANYLRFMERSRTEWLRARGGSQQQLATESSLLFTVVSVQIDYQQPARLDDALVVTCEPEPDGRVTMRFVQRIHRDSLAGPVLAAAVVRVACVDAKTLKPKRIPEFVLRSEVR